MLNVLNRVIVSVLLVGLAVVLLAVAVTPEGVASFAAARLSQVRVDPFSVDHLLIAVICLAVDALCVILLRLQWSRRQPRSVPLHSSPSSELATESVVERLRADVSALPQVIGVNPTIHARGNVVDVGLDVRTVAGVDVPSKAAEVDQVARESVERLGLKLGRVRTKIAVARGSAAPPAPSTG
jgi:hypothetical protein